MDGALTDDERRVVAAAHRLNLIRTSRWPMVAAHLLAQGVDDAPVAELAGLPSTASPWVVDQLVLAVLTVLGLPDMSAEDAGAVIAPVIGAAAAERSDADEFTVIRTLARLSPDQDFPSGIFNQAYYSAEWLDCQCHPQERDAAKALEAALRSGPPLHADPSLLAALRCGWI
ncbi:MAG TPA: hypothetical protein PLS68_08510 [Actinotalea sp.]|nr:hypothetical protein [Actinotalea sp.]